MYAVGRIGSYITRGVYTVSGPFHPFGGAVDIIVVQQPDGSFKSSPWYVRFGKFQGVLKTKEKIVNISVNGVEANFYMYLDNKGEAYFLREADQEEEGKIVLYPSSSGDETDGQPEKSTIRPVKSKTSTSDVDESIPAESNRDGEVVNRPSRTTSKRSRILGLVFGQRSMNQDRYQEGKDNAGVVRVDSLERAEIAADLLEVKWSTNLASNRNKKDYPSQFSAPNMSNKKVDKDLVTNDKKSQVDSSVCDDTKNNSNDPCILQDNASFSNELACNSSQSSPDSIDSCRESANGKTPCKLTVEQVVETSTLVERLLDENCEVLAVVSKDIDEFISASAGLNDNSKCSISEIRPDSQTLNDHEAYPTSGPFGAEQFCCERVDEDNQSDRVQAFLFCETSESSIVDSDGSSEQTCETLVLARGGSGEVHVFAETLLATGKLQCEDTVIEKAEGTKLEMIDVEVSEGFSEHTNSSPCIHEYKNMDLEEPGATSGSSSLKVNVDSAIGTATVESENTSADISDIGRLIEAKENNMTSPQPSSFDSAGNSQSLCGDRVPLNVLSIPSSKVSEEEDQFLFSDLEEFKHRKVQSVRSLPLDSNTDNCSYSLPSTIELDKQVNVYDKLSLQPDNFVQEKHLAELGNSIEESRVVSKSIDIPGHVVARGEVWQLGGSLPNICFYTDSIDANNGLEHPLSHSLDSNVNPLKWTILRKEEISSDAKRSSQLVMEQGNDEDTQISGAHEVAVVNPAVRDASDVSPPSGNWILWPFSSRKSRSQKDPLQATQPAPGSCDAKGSEPCDAKGSNTENTLKSRNGIDEGEDVPQPKATKKMVVVKAPTSKQLASLNLKEGRNTVNFNFSTAMLGDQGVDARIYLWKWNTRIVISDVDGTITKSDVLGQFMPLVGMDWSQTGVTHFYSAIEKNGYHFLFLSARAISQASLTRQFLVNLKQDGKALPDGPIVISPDGLFPSLYREVIRRAPHEFKIACLEDIKALFPSDCSPFYAGFGNRDTDEISYLKVGIPKGKIFIINPRGEVAVNRRVHDTKSYPSLHALVHGMFPDTLSSEQEDFNSWNFWKMPTVIDL